MVVPSGKSLSIGVVKGEKVFKPEWENRACNLVSVEFYMSKGSVFKIKRGDLLQKLESRLKVKTAIADLVKFQDEIREIIDSISEDEDIYQSCNIYTKHVKAAEKNFKDELLQSIRNETIRLSAGGNGLERLIKELLEIDGYKAKIKTKKQSPDIADIDIEAKKEGRFFKTCLLIQAKHHRGETDGHGLKQLMPTKIMMLPARNG